MGQLTFNGYFSGHINVVAVVEHLLRRPGTELAAATDVLLSGDSAGGMGTFHNIDWLADRLPWASVKVQT